MTELALYIDIEGFGLKFENGGKKSFIDLTNDLHSLGQNIFSYLSIIQFGGDGFLIKENLSYENKISRFIDLSVALLQIITLRGGTGRVQISNGYMSDISGLYSNEIQKEIQSNNQNILGGNNYNIMLINPVIGTSIINCYKLKGPKGPLLLVDNNLKEMLETEKIAFETLSYGKCTKYEVLNINWLKSKNENTELILNHFNFKSIDVEEALTNYIETNALGLTNEWRSSALNLLK